jgi:hypothetical protein
VTLRSDGLGHLRIEVRDGKGRMSSPAAPCQGAISGRGLVLVSTLATSWGTQMVSDGESGVGRAPRQRPRWGQGVPGVGRLVLEDWMCQSDWAGPGASGEASTTANARAQRNPRDDVREWQHR